MPMSYAQPSAQLLPARGPIPGSCRHAFAASRRVSPGVFCSRHALKTKGAGKAGCRPAPTVRCAHVAQKELHSGIQVWPNTRPSLRDGWTAYAVLSREPNSFWPPSPDGSHRHRAGWRDAASARLDRSDDGRDHTVLPYASDPASPRGFARHRAPFVQRGLRDAHGVRLNPSPRPATRIRDGAARVHRDPIRGS